MDMFYHKNSERFMNVSRSPLLLELSLRSNERVISYFSFQLRLDNGPFFSSVNDNGNVVIFLELW